ncbi:MAG: M43 family zinc metalloprotease [Flavobacteriales bacterium]|nr:M43 family zinc metalloprotease [Flavobacteriales bacterium]
MHADSLLRARNPHFQSRMDFEIWMEKQIKVYKQQQSLKAQPPVYTIPVIFHIIHDGDPVGSGANLSQSQVNSQVTVLNEDFRKITGTNGHNNHPDGADVEIEFCSAVVDPSGNTLAEPGINRIDRSTMGWSSPPYSINYTDNTIKPNSQWDPNSYLNIWVCELSSGLLGYAQFPEGSGLPGMPAGTQQASTDGVVCTSNSVGAAPHNSHNWAFNLGRTATHEIGHWLGLIHIWGDQNGCGGTDYCGDTPDCSGPFAASHPSCSAPQQCGSTRQIENYMDYSDDGCMNMFTNDQTTRMRTVLTSSPRRMSLTSSTVCSGGGGGAAPSCNFTASTYTVNQGGTVDFTDQSGNAPTSWSWTFNSGNPGTAGTQNPTNITFNTVGTYDVTLIATNAFGTCSLTQQVNVISSQPCAGFGVTATSSDPSCGQADGSVTASTTGGAAPFTYAWSNGATSQTVNNLAAGVYIVSVTDDNNCVKTFSVTLVSNEPAISDSIVDASCGGGNDGAVLLNVSGGTSPYTYNWSNGSNAANLTNVATGNYDLTLTDAGGCQIVASYTVNNAGGLGSQASSVNTNCSNSCDGSASVSGQGGTSPYSYSWSNGASGTNINGLCPGTYYASVTDAAGCVSIEQVLINSSQNMIMSSSVTDATCNNSNGSATANATGGTAPYSYSWINSNGIQVGLTATATGLDPDVYDVIISDATGCSDTLSVFVGNEGGINANASGDKSICVGDSVTLFASGGGNYSWSNGSTANIISVSPPTTTTYTVTISDGFGCSEIENIQVEVNSPPTVTIKANPDSAACPGMPVLLSASGAQSYVWNVPGSGNGPSITVFPNGFSNYSVVGYNGNCAGQPVSVSIDVALPAPVANASSDKNIVYLSSGATVNFSNLGSVGSSYQWDFDGNGVYDYNGGLGTASYTYNSVGSFDAVLRAQLGSCFSTDTLTIFVQAVASVGGQSLSEQITVYPNPSFGEVSISGNFGTPTGLEIQVFDAIGQNVHTVNYRDATAILQTIDLSPYGTGLYYVRLSTARESETFPVNIITQ